MPTLYDENTGKGRNLLTAIFFVWSIGIYEKKSNLNDFLVCFFKLLTSANTPCQ